LHYFGNLLFAIQLKANAPPLAPNKGHSLCLQVITLTSDVILYQMVQYVQSNHNLRRPSQNLIWNHYVTRTQKEYPKKMEEIRC